MRKVSQILLVIILFSSCAMTKNIRTAELRGQKWSVLREISPGTGSGNSWTFLSGNRFIEIDWYAGGAYWTHHYTGTYLYDQDHKTVFLKYNKHPHLKNVLKKRLALKITATDTILTVTNGWKKPKEDLQNIKHSLKIHDTVFENYIFKIEIIDK